MTWQKQLRALLGVLVLLLIAGVAWYATRQRAENGPPGESPRLDPKATLEVSGDEIVRTDKDGKVVFRLKYDHLSHYPEERRARLRKITGTIARDDKPVEFRADEADVKLKSAGVLDVGSFDEMVMRGAVVVKSGTDLYLETSEATYNDVTGIMTTDKPAKIKRGSMSGSGTGLTFDRNRSVVWLLADATVNLATSDQGPLSVTSARAGLAEADHYMRFEERVRMERDGRVIETDAAVANLTPDAKGITILELRGHSSVKGAPAGSGGVPNMSADDITITYGAESGLLERANLMRAARLELPEGGGRSITAGLIDIGFSGDGSLVTVLDATEAVEVKIPAERDLPAREVRAPKLQASGAAPKGLDRAEFTGGVEFRERAPANGRTGAANSVGCSETASADRVGCAEKLVLGLDGGFDKIKNADFSGNVRFRDKDITGEAPKAEYGVDTKRIALHGGAGLARVVQDDGTIDAKEIDLTLDPRKIVATGTVKDPVKSTIKPGARKDRKEPRPSILEDDEPVTVTSRTLDYDGTTERAVYAGDARLWQADTVIQAETITLDDKSGNLDARKTSPPYVRAQFLIREQAVAGAKPAPEKKPASTFAEAEELTYDESQRKVMLRQNARLRGPEANITADRIELFLQEDGNTLDRAEGYGKITARLEGRVEGARVERKVTGDRLTYNAKIQRYDISGRPLVVEEQRVEKGQTKCYETTGASLTFDRSTDNFSVLGANRAPTRGVAVACKPTKDPRLP